MPETRWIRTLMIIVCCAGAGSRSRAAELTRCNGFNDAQTAWAAVAAGSDVPIPLRPLSPTVFLPDGSEFLTWEMPAAPLRTFYVAQRDPRAADSNPGTETRPWKTIGRAASMLEPGDRVVVREGTYREWVRPRRGGTGPTRMITYQAAPGETVILSGADPFAGEWAASARPGQSAVGQAWMAELPDGMFGTYNPFAETNCTAHMTGGLKGMAARFGWLKPPYTLSRGLLFQDGKRLHQVAEYGDLALTNGAYWVEPGGGRVHLRTPDGRPPAGASFEITTRPFAFAPEQSGLGFIRITGFLVERVANAYPVPQRGAISTMQGHHWIIDKNIVREVNALGLDYGRRQTFIPYAVPEDTPKLAGVGTIVRGNAFYACGVCSLSGLGLIGGVIEDNLSEGCGWQRVMGLCEAGGFKMHYMKHCLIRGNVVRDVVNAHGLWVDHSNHNTRITRNVVAGGGLYLEATYGPTLIDHNIIWNGGMLLEHSGNTLIACNLIGKCGGLPIRVGRPNPAKKRQIDIETRRFSSAEQIRILGNVFYGFADRGPSLTNDTGNLSDYNLFVNPPGEKSIDLAARQKNLGFETHSRTATAEITFSQTGRTVQGSWPVLSVPGITNLTHDFFGIPRAGVTEAGPFVQANRNPRTPLWRGREARVPIPVVEGGFVPVYAPRGDLFSGPDTQDLKAGVFYDAWQPNDHCFVKGPDGRWHAFGITHPESRTGQRRHQGEYALFHAVSGADTLAGSLSPQSWADKPKVLAPSQRLGENINCHAPTIMRHDGRYKMIYGPCPFRLAVSDDLSAWTPQGPVGVNEKSGRDPSLFFWNGTHILVYCAGNAVKAATSTNLTDWTEPVEIYRGAVSTYQCESPTIVARDGVFVLFWCLWDTANKRHGNGYDELSFAVCSDDPLDFRGQPVIAELLTHAPEVFQDERQDWFLSSVQYPARGVSLARLSWK
jgi:hypothetical protein